MGLDSNAVECNAMQPLRGAGFITYERSIDHIQCLQHEEKH